jgi:hypothetical protein
VEEPARNARFRARSKPRCPSRSTPGPLARQKAGRTIAPSACSSAEVRARCFSSSLRSSGVK